MAWTITARDYFFIFIGLHLEIRYQDAIIMLVYTLNTGSGVSQCFVLSSDGNNDDIFKRQTMPKREVSA